MGKTFKPFDSIMEHPFLLYRDCSSASVKGFSSIPGMNRGRTNVQNEYLLGTNVAIIPSRSEAPGYLTGNPIMAVDNVDRLDH